MQLAQVSKSFRKEAHDPHSFLGLHPYDEERKVIRLWRPGASSVYLEVFGEVVEAAQADVAGVFEYLVSQPITYKDYRIYHQNGLLAHDPYAFLPTFGEVDAHLFGKGVHYELFQVMGGRLTIHQGCEGVKFALWAPHAAEVSLVGDFNFWDGRLYPMRSMGVSGVWELFVPGLQEKQRYKFEIKSPEGQLLIKSDPFALFSELRPKNASVVFDVDRYEWKDSAWMEKRVSNKDKPQPLNIYEVHLGSWKSLSNYREMAHELARYCQEMHVTHIELLPIAEHPLDESWGYQVSGFYAVTSRYGTPEDFQYFVDYMHGKGIGVLLDWVGAHFPVDAFSLAKFDGSYLYEHADPKQGHHPHWNTLIFNYGRHEVSNFLIASALFWLNKMHIDGLRVDAVASMLYLDYGRQEGEWIPNVYGGKENIEAIAFLKHLNAAIRDRGVGALVIAEESTSFTGVTHPLEWGGLGFDMKWNLGWMNDTLRFFQKEPIFRSYHQNDLTFGLLYAFSERFMLVLSHDEVVHGKGSLLSKMPGDDWQKFANLRALYSYMMCQPGKKLLFMGAEIGQWAEWNCKEELHWHLLEHARHRQLQHFVSSMNHFYLEHSPLWQYDFDPKGFEWLDLSDQQNSSISYLRKGEGCYLACVHNFTPTYFPSYFVRLPNVDKIREVFNSDKEEFGGSGKVNSHVEKIMDAHGSCLGVQIQLSPLATLIFEVSFVS